MFEVFDWQNVTQNSGIAVSLTGMSIVFVALVSVSGFIAWLPRILTTVAGFFPESEETHDSVSQVQTDDDALVAAIGYALHVQLSRQDGK